MKTVNSGLKFISLLAGLIAGLLALFVSTAFADVDCDKWRPPEISINDRISWDIDNRSLINVFFDRDKNKKYDFVAIYRQSQQDYGFSTPSTTPEEMAKRFPNNLIVSTQEKVVLSENTDFIPSGAVGVVESRSEYGKTRFSHYVLNKHPLYYILDRNEDGINDIILYDAEEDGINGNERLEYCHADDAQKKHYIENPEENVDGKKKEYEIKWPDLDKAVKDGSKYLDKE